MIINDGDGAHYSEAAPAAASVYNIKTTAAMHIMNKRLTERVSDFLTAVNRLEEALMQPENSFMRDATIQRFEFTYELAWKALTLWLESKDIIVLNAKDVLQAALEQGGLVDGNGWTQLHRMRNLTSHTYDETQAVRVYQFIKTDGFQLFRALAEKVGAWET